MTAASVAPRAPALAAAALVALTSTPAGAGDPDGGDAAEADELFDRAAALMAEGRWDEACPKFERSFRIDPARGTLLGVAQCHEKRGEVASAHAAYESLLHDARAAGDDPRAAIARGRLAALEPALPRLAIHLAEDADAEALAIRRGDEILAADDFGVPLPVDPGIYEITAEKPGAEPWSEQVAVAEGESKSIVIPALPARQGSDGAPAAPAGDVDEPPPGAGASRLRAGPPRYQRDGNLAQRWLGYSAISGGALSTAAGVGFAVRAIRKHRSYRDACPDSGCTAGEAGRLRDDRDSATTLATGFIGVGLVAITGGIVLWATASKPGDHSDARRRPRLAPLVGPTGVGASLRARF